MYMVLCSVFSIIACLAMGLLVLYVSERVSMWMINRFSVYTQLLSV